MTKALFDGLPSADKDMFARVDGLLKRVEALRETGSDLYERLSLL